MNITNGYVHIINCHIACSYATHFNNYIFPFPIAYCIYTSPSTEISPPLHNALTLPSIRENTIYKKILLKACDLLSTQT